MPIGFLTTADHDRLTRFPAQIPDEDLRAFFLLSDADQTAINHQREDATRLGFALQLCALRYLGFAPDELTTTPGEVVAYVARQLDVPPEAIQAYGQRRKTRTTHLVQIQMYLGFRLATPLDLSALQTWLGERALEHDKPVLSTYTLKTGVMILVETNWNRKLTTICLPEEYRHVPTKNPG